MRIFFIIFGIFYYASLGVCSSSVGFAECKQHVQTFAKKNNFAGVALGIIQVDSATNEVKKETFFHGDVSRTSKISWKESSPFPLGPLTHLFSSLILVDAVVQKKCKWKDPVSSFFPKNFNLPAFHGQEMSLLDLALDTSALVDPSPLLERFSSFQWNEVEGYLRRNQLRYAPGSKKEITYVGRAIGNKIAEKISAQSFIKLFDEEITEVLGCKNTLYRFPKDQKSKFVIGHKGLFSVDLNKLDHPWSPMFSTYGLSSSLEDLLQFCSFCLGGYVCSLSSLLPEYFKLYVVQNHAVDNEVTLAWRVSQLAGTNSPRIHYQTNTFMGCSIFIALARELKMALVLMTNQEIGLEIFGRELLSLMIEEAAKANKDLLDGK